jgi:hypothetical protein
VRALALHSVELVLLQEAAHDRLGDRVGVHVVLAAADLPLYLAQAHLAWTFLYRLHMTDQLWV